MKLIDMLKGEENVYSTKSDFEELLKKLTPMELDSLWSAIQEHEHFEKIFERADDIRKRIQEMETYIDDVKDSYDEVCFLYDKMVEANFKKK